MQIINTKSAPEAVGPYSQAVLAGNILFVSGQIPLNPQTQTLISGDIKEQTKQCLENVQAIVLEAGGDIEKIVKCCIFLQNMNDFAAVNEVYASFFGSHKPARVCVEVSKLPKSAAVEIDAIAAI
ncbi:MAG: RidA family protein [Endomicrobium sp.]|nr:RidA family protein [Endomicrobium sp.]